MIREALILVLLSTFAFALMPLDETPPQGLPADALVEETEILVEAPVSDEKSVDLTLTRIIPEKAFANEEFTVTLRVENNHVGEIEMLLVEPMRTGVEYINAPEPHIIYYEALEIRLLRWTEKISPGQTMEYEYMMRPGSPGSITFPPATVNDQYGNTFESKPMHVMVQCLPDGVCGPGENYINCPKDCSTGSADGICDGVADGRIDPDCTPESDPDYQRPVQEKTNYQRPVQEKTKDEESGKDSKLCNIFPLSMLSLILTLFSKRAFH